MATTRSMVNQQQPSQNIWNHNANSSSSAAGNGDLGIHSTNFSLPFNNINNFVSQKLDSSNFLLWQDQIESIFISTDLIGYINGEIEEPVKEIIEKGTKIVNPKWLYW